MSRLVADQESRGGAGDKESGMRMTLAEGCGAVNDARGVGLSTTRRGTRRGKREPAGFSCLFGLSGLFD